MSFRVKLLLAMMLVVGAITTATLLGTQRTVEKAYDQIFEQQFRNQVASFTQLQEARLAGVRAESSAFVKSVRVIAPFIEIFSEANPDIGDLYKYCRAELDRPDSSVGQRRHHLRFLDAKGSLLIPSGSQTNLPPRFLDEQIKALTKTMAQSEDQQTGYLAGASDASNPELHEVVLTKIIDTEEDRVLGAMILAFPQSDPKKSGDITSGIYLDGEIYWTTIPEKIRVAVAARISSVFEKLADKELRISMRIDGEPHSLFVRAIDQSAGFPRAYQVSVYSLKEAARVEQELRHKIFLYGALAMIAALAISYFLSHGLSVPINELVRGTHSVEQGNFETRVIVRSKDEIGQLADSFNQMTAGLALKEKYRSVLDVVADKRIAEDLIHGKIELGGEERAVSVLFCDIRGFTAITQNMEPPEVIQLLNEHFTPLTRVVYEHHGVVDKFVGDMIMAVFGAPTSHGNDPLLAAQCALRMIEERAKLNANSKYKISVGIGIASGKAVAGRMGSKNRLNYTVLGPRVNLASRLCGQADRMEIVIDDATYQTCRDRADVEPLPELKLKGFSETVHAYKLKSLRPA